MARCARNVQGHAGVGGGEQKQSAAEQSAEADGALLRARMAVERRSLALCWDGHQ